MDHVTTSTSRSFPLFNMILVLYHVTVIMNIQINNVQVVNMFMNNIQVIMIIVIYFPVG